MNAADMHNSLPSKDDNKWTDVKKTSENLNEHIISRENVIYEQCVFFNRQQTKQETIQNYVAAPWKQASACNFNSSTPDDIFRDRIVCRLHARNDQLQQSLVRQSNLTLKDCI